MEENNKAKTITMGNGSNKEEKKQKLTYEQLNDACSQLVQLNRQLVVRNRELEQLVMGKRLDYLFKVLEFRDSFHGDFVIGCTNEIEEGLALSNEKQKED